MSKFVQTTVAPVAGSATVEAYVNVYKQADGSIRPGSRVFRKEANARKHAKSTVGNEFIGVEKITISRSF
jgi:hypothetical protein